MRLSKVAALALACATFSGAAYGDEAAFPKFRPQEIDKSLKVGYGVVVADFNNDGKKDIAVADTTRVVLWENQGADWKMRTILQGKTKPDNVCLDPHDIDGDGKLDLALGA